MIKILEDNLQSLRRENPLILNITNVVVTNITANALLAIGASPVMAYEEEEIEEMTSISKALVVNIGTLTKELVQTTFTAIKKANDLSIPVIFDPVGVGATTYRSKVAHDIINNFKIDAIRGNSSEIANLSGFSIKTKGVDADGEVGEIVDLSCDLAQKHQCVVCASGARDIITDSKTTYGVKNGDIMLTKITGSGCISTAVMGAFMSVDSDILTACLTGAVMVGIAGEIAGSRSKGQGQFQTAFFDNLSLFDKENLKLSKIDIL